MQQGQTIYPCQPLFINGGQGTAGRYEFRLKARKLHPPNGGHDIAHVVTPALTFDVRIPRTATRKALLRVVGHRKQAGVRSQLPCFLVKGHQAAALTAGDIFDAVKAEAHHVAKAADLAAVAFAAKGMGGVFHHTQALGAGKAVDGIELPGVAGIVHGHDGDGAGGQTALGIGKINGAGIGQHITGHRRAAGSGNGLKRRHKGERGNENFGCAADIALRGNGVHSQMQGRSACIDGNNLAWLYAKVLRHFFFKKAHFVAHAKIAVFSNNAANGAGFSFTHNGTGKTHGHKASCCGGMTVADRLPRLALASGRASSLKKTVGSGALKNPPSVQIQGCAPGRHANPHRRSCRSITCRGQAE